MTTYKTVVSWLAFLFLAYATIKRSAVLVWRWILLELNSIDPDRWSYSFEGPSVPLGTKADLGYAFCWIVIMVLLVSPWLRWRWNARKISLDDTLSIWLNTAGRWICAVIYSDHLFQWLAFHPSEFMRKLHHGDLYSSVGEYFADAIRPVILGVSAAMLITPEIVRVASSGFTAFIDAVFFPGGREKIPPYTLKLARFYVEKQRWADAEAEFARVLAFHPQQLEAWQERLDLALRRKAQADPVPQEVLAKALKSLKNPADREAVHQRFLRGQIPPPAMGYPPPGRRVS